MRGSRQFLLTSHVETSSRGYPIVEGWEVASLPSLPETEQGKPSVTQDGQNGEPGKGGLSWGTVF